MAAYLQQGNDSWNLIGEPDLGNYQGLILSPVNDSFEEVKVGLRRLRHLRDEMEVILDPQLYNPHSNRGSLKRWPYFPKDLETASRDRAWWANVSNSVVAAARDLRLDAVCSPIEVPRRFDHEYFQHAVHVADDMHDVATQSGLQTLMTLIIRLHDLAAPRASLDIASIVTSSKCDRVYLTFLVDEQDAKVAIDDEQALPTALHLVRLLSKHMRVHVAFCAHDVVLWKYAGAADASSGKYFNLRRFSLTRWDDKQSGGSQADWWNDDVMLTLLRELDVATLHKAGLLGVRNFDDNPVGEAILRTITVGPRKAWRALSWVQHLRWFYNSEKAIKQPADAIAILQQARREWERVRDIPFSDPHNISGGAYVERWLKAMEAASKRN